MEFDAQFLLWNLLLVGVVGSVTLWLAGRAQLKNNRSRGVLFFRIVSVVLLLILVVVPVYVLVS